MIGNAGIKIYVKDKALPDDRSYIATMGRDVVCCMLYHVTCFMV